MVIMNYSNNMKLETKTIGNIIADNPKITSRNVNVFYHDKQAINNVSLDVGSKEIISLIGPSGCGKSTFLRCLIEWMILLMVVR